MAKRCIECAHGKANEGCKLANAGRIEDCPEGKTTTDESLYPDRHKCGDCEVPRWSRGSGRNYCPILNAGGKCRFGKDKVDDSIYELDLLPKRPEQVPA